MLTKPRMAVSVGAVLAAGVLVLIASLGLIGSAAASPTSTPSASGTGPVNCPPQDIDPRTKQCTITVTSPPGQPSSGPSSSKGGSGGGSRQCILNDPTLGQKIVPCYLDGFGWYQNNCYYRLSDPQPPLSDLVWSGEPPGGAAYDARCFGQTKYGPSWPGTILLPVKIWLQNPPPTGNGPTPLDLAKQAEAQMSLNAPTIGSAPLTGGSGLVGMPVWLWTEQTPLTWGPQSKTVAVPGLSVTATATAKSIAWDMGDGHQFSCPNPGTKYLPSYGGAASPNCGYTYNQPSGGNPNGEYKITATTTWQVSWVASTGQTGTLPPVTTPPSTTTVKIGELQVVNH